MMSCKWNDLVGVLLCLLSSLTMTFSNFTSVVACIALHSFCGSMTDRCMGRTPLVCPLIGWWALRLLPPFGYCEYGCYQHSRGSFCVYGSMSLGHIPGICCCLNFLLLCRMQNFFLLFLFALSMHFLRGALPLFLWTLSDHLLSPVCSFFKDK